MRFIETKQVLPLNIMTERAPTSSPEYWFQESVVFPDPCRFASDKESGPVRPKSGFSKQFLPWLYWTLGSRVSDRDRETQAMGGGARQTNYFPPLYAVTSRELGEQAVRGAKRWEDQDRI